VIVSPNAKNFDCKRHKHCQLPTYVKDLDCLMLNIHNGLKPRYVDCVEFYFTYPRPLFRKALANRAISSSTRTNIFLATLESKAAHLVNQSSALS
jgi:hypothetical protein